MHNNIIMYSLEIAHCTLMKHYHLEVKNCCIVVVYGAVQLMVALSTLLSAIIL